MKGVGRRLARAVSTLEAMAKLESDTERLDEVERLRRELDDADVELVWSSEAYDGSRDYALLLRGDDQGWLSIASSRSHLPWPLRGVRRWREEDVVRVNNRVVKMEDAVAFLEIESPRTQVARRLVDSSLMQEALGSSLPTATRAEMRAEEALFRQRQGLVAPPDLAAWLRLRGWHRGDLERLIEDRLLRRRLRERIIPDGAIDEYFAEHRDDFDLREIEWVWRRNVRAAREAVAMLIETKRTIADLAQEVLPYREGEVELPLRVWRRRRDLGEDFALLFASPSGTAFGPLAYERGWVVGRTLRHLAPELTIPLRNQIRGHLFESWLRSRRESAEIEWLWGRRDEDHDRGPG